MKVYPDEWTERSCKGIIIGGIMVASFTIVYALEKKSTEIVVWGMLICLPNILYYAIYSIVKAAA